MGSNPIGPVFTLENFQEFLSELQSSKLHFIVEGKKDEFSLRQLGVKNIKAINRQPLFQFIESIDEKEVAILTDLDSEGKKLYSELHYFLEKRKIKIDNCFRNFLFRGTDLKQIEGLHSFLLKQNVFI